MSKHEVIFKKDGEIKKDIIEARNQSAAVEKCKVKHNTTHIIGVRKPKIDYRKITNKFFGRMI
ncbi:hypothetical protein SAMN04515654_12142 [Halanaerobium congolense]|jgi:vacuolar-type H+-ATPase subunit D/Vma8|uniref:Uncharacterized protein n=1 Tax=Halanaerobium congolense TaxID=54121 RepID=A0A1G8PVG5_9FIRM|nr:hypothetical protein [Halanaerobium congolense]SDI96423.1 hypothetical protein SAMN04515654_12142 [Halanaerobium congolense]SES91121.1 hypothetical protein SAMN04515653_10442 [Halanaerobium congolense]